MQTIQNPRLYIRRKASAEGRAPRTMQEAFPQYPDSNYQEPDIKSKCGDCIAVAIGVAVFGLAAYYGPALIWGLA